MPRVTAGGRRLSVTADVPTAVADVLRRVRRRAASPGAARSPLVVADRVPPVHVVARDPAQAIAFLPAPPAAKAGRAAGDGSLAQRVDSIWWYHTIDLGNGVVTPGFYDHRPLVERYGIPADLSERRVLDVATFDGFWAFEMERRGASVVATDIPSASDLDLPPQALRLLEEEGADRISGEGFRLAHEVLGSSVERVLCNVYDLDPSRVGTFDFVHVADLLLHLKSPIAALQAIRRVTRGQALVVDCFDPALEGQGMARYLGGWSGATWWAHSLDTLAQMVVDAGFAAVDVHLVYALGNAAQPHGTWRAALLARV